MAAAAGRCQCRGTCGKSHAKNGGRCDRVHDGHKQHHGGGRVHLLAAPADPAGLLLPPHRIAALPKQALAAWCERCHDATRKKHQTTVAADEPDALF
ncbi:hypothetical protein J5Y04_28515 [Kitasatospora sp. RG8]|nr:hypothetical protein [Kitasatospora sp. RG8]